MVDSQLEGVSHVLQERLGRSLPQGPVVAVIPLHRQLAPDALTQESLFLMFLCHEALFALYIMIKLVMIKNIKDTSCSACFRLCGRKYHTLNTTMDDGTCAHNTRF